MCLRREIHAAQKVLKARVGTQGIEPWIDFDVGHPLIVVVIGLFKPCEGLTVLTKGSVDHRHLERRNVPSL